MQNIHVFSDGQSINLDAKRPTVPPGMLAELKQHPALYAMYLEKVNAYNRRRIQERIQSGEDYRALAYAAQRRWSKTSRGREKLAAASKRFKATHKQRVLGCRIRNIIWHGLFGKVCKKSAEVYLGCSLQAFRTHIESQFKEGMSWGNFGQGIGKWCFDHIRPLAFYDLSDPEQAKACFSYQNTQPLWFRENSLKWFTDKATGRADSRLESLSAAPSLS